MRAVGVCEPMANLPDDPHFGRVTIDFQGVVVNYLAKYEKINLAQLAAKVRLLQPPAHGQLSEIGNGAASFRPTPGFHGQDKIVALVELGGYQVKVVYFIKVQPEGTGGIATDDDEVIKQFCGPKGRTWKISTATFPNLQMILTAAMQSWYIDYTPYLDDVHQGPIHHSNGPVRIAAQASEFSR